VQLILHGLGCLEQAGLRGERAPAAKLVDCPVARGHDQPRAGIRRDPSPPPALGGDREGLLDSFLGEIEVAEEANQGGEHPGPLVAKYLLDQR
jgi:hypothetical protein